MKRKEMTLIQRELVLLRKFRYQEAVMVVRQREQELRNSLELIAKELNVDFSKETWTVSEDGLFLEQVSVEKKEEGA